MIRNTPTESAKPNAQAFPDDITGLLVAWGGGDRDALDRLMPLVYQELRRLAHRRMRREREGDTFQTTALVNEAYLRLVDYERVKARDRTHFFAIAAQAMRRILVERGRSRRCHKRGSNPQRISLEDVAGLADERAPDLGGAPVAVDRGGGDAEHIRRLFDGQPAEIPQFDELGLARVNRSKCLKRIVERNTMNDERGTMN